MVKVRGELWSANSRDDLKPGEKVNIIGINGLILVVQHPNVDFEQPSAPGPKQKLD